MVVDFCVGDRVESYVYVFVDGVVWCGWFRKLLLRSYDEYRMLKVGIVIYET